MSKVSSFFGITVEMRESDFPGPNFFAHYDGYQGCFDFEGIPICTFNFPDTAVSLLKSWINTNRLELMINWTRLETGLKLSPITPLK